jgi:integrase
MMFEAGHTPSHKGKTTTVDPIKTLDGVVKVKELLKGHVRNKALFVVAVNSALRAGDLTNLKWEDAHDDGVNITLRVLEGKTKKPRTIPLNGDASQALREWRAKCDSEFIYSGQRGALTTAQWGRMIKSWCKDAGLEGQFASHTARKSFVRIQHDEFNTSLTTLMVILNHSSPTQTLTYMGRMADDVTKAYGNAI